MKQQSFKGMLVLVAALLLASCSSFDATVASLSVGGEYHVLTYTDFPDVPEFGNGTIYYPQENPGTVGGVAIAPGFRERQSHIEWWGPRLASHGFAVLILDTNERGAMPDARGDALLAAVDVLRRESTRNGSPLFGRVATDRMAIMGHSMGGGGALLAANEHPDRIQAAIPFTPWEPRALFRDITAPTLVLAGRVDRIAGVDNHAWRHYQSIPESTPKAYLELEDGNHYIADTERGTDLETVGRYGIAWLKLYLDEDVRYERFIYGDLAASDSGKFSRFVTSP